MLELTGVSKVFEKDNKPFVALEKVDMRVDDGEFITFVGPSGCGKTTLLKMIDGLLPKSSGQIRMDGHEIVGVPHEMAFVFQDINLFPWRSAVENVAMALEPRGVPRAEQTRRALEALRLVNMEREAHSPTYQLSGGMQQRVGVARALVVEPKVLLMDEPFGHLDAFTREQLQIELLKLWENLHTTVAFVTHDVDEAILLSQRIALFDTNPGRLIEILDVDMPGPRWDYDVRGHSRAIELRRYISERLHVREAS